jgi:hypothetical protein
MALVICPAIGSQSFCHTSRVLVSQSARRHDSTARMPDGRDVSGSSQWSARRMDSSTAARCGLATAGSSVSWGLRDLLGQIPVHRTAAGIGQHLLQLGQKSLQLRGIVRVWAAGTARHLKTERGVGHADNGTRSRQRGRQTGYARWTDDVGPGPGDETGSA